MKQIRWLIVYGYEREERHTYGTVFRSYKSVLSHVKWLQSGGAQCCLCEVMKVDGGLSLTKSTEMQ